MILSKYVRTDSGHLILRAVLPDDHPESWPSKAGQDLPDDWKHNLRDIPYPKEAKE